MESEKAGLKFNIQKTKIMATSPITSWQIDGETNKTVRYFIFLASRITTDGDCFHEIKRCLLLGKKALTNLVVVSCQVVSDSVTPWTAARQASLSPTIFQSLPKFMSIALVMPSSHLRELLLGRTKLSQKRNWTSAHCHLTGQSSSSIFLLPCACSVASLVSDSL